MKRDIILTREEADRILDATRTLYVASMAWAAVAPTRGRTGVPREDREEVYKRAVEAIRALIPEA